MCKLENNKLVLLIFLFVSAALVTSWRMGPVFRVAANLPVDKFQFIQYDDNHIDMRGNGSQWDSLFRKFEMLAFTGKGNISIVHIGGSHVQGGALSDKLRSDFSQMVYGAEGERGFVFPYELAKSNSPKSIRCKWNGKWNSCRNSVSGDSCLWGMSGISATTYDSLAGMSVQVMSYDSVAYQFNRVRIYNQRSENVTIIPDSSMKLVSITDVPTHGYTDIQYAGFNNVVRFNIQRNDSLPSYFTFQGMYLDDGEDGLTYNAIGVNGASTRSYLRCAMMKPQLETLRPDLVIFGIGVNDANVPESDFDEARYEARYDSLVGKFLDVNPNTCFLFVTNNDTYYQKKGPNRNALKVRDVMYRLADKYDGAVYDLFSIMGGLGSIRKWQNADLAASDKIHLSKKGYELQADMMTNAFMEAFGNYLDKKQVR